MSQVSENLRAVEQRVKGLHPKGETVTIVGVTKGQPFERVREAVDAGLQHLGNNYVQDGALLMGEFVGRPLSWHFIGHIQSRKVKQLLPYECIQSVSRLEVAVELDRRLGEAQKTASVLVEVNIAAEPTKSGVAPLELVPFLQKLRGLKHLELAGLMCLPPPLEPVEDRKPFFDQMYALYSDNAAVSGFRWLSMGTSDDFSVAVSSGANMIRLGTTLFGRRG